MFKLFAALFEHVADLPMPEDEIEEDDTEEETGTGCCGDKCPCGDSEE